ncbi:MAG: hypothetical protein MK102_06265 [Fuerstiella sp.]|nr:hypothetical protein [Fuerstiella sp.]
MTFRTADRRVFASGSGFSNPTSGVETRIMAGGSGIREFLAGNHGIALTDSGLQQYSAESE